MAKGDSAATSGTYYAISHDAVGPVYFGWVRGRVIGPDDQPQGDAALTDAQWTRLRQIGAIRPATDDEVAAYEAAKKKAADEDVPFASFFVGNDPVGGVQPQTPAEAAVQAAQEAATGTEQPS